jgi:small subunit ribosomal protein S17
MPRRIFEGVVVSDTNDKTVVVRVESKIKHPVYKKYILRSSKYSAHDPENQCKKGEIVKIIEGRPVSKSKRWHVVYSSSADGKVA